MVRNISGLIKKLPGVMIIVVMMMMMMSWMGIIKRESGNGVKE